MTAAVQAACWYHTTPCPIDMHQIPTSKYNIANNYTIKYHFLTTVIDTKMMQLSSFASVDELDVTRQ
jgi:hypothetical protein